MSSEFWYLKVKVTITAGGIYVVTTVCRDMHSPVTEWMIFQIFVLPYFIIMGTCWLLTDILFSLPFKECITYNMYIIFIIIQIYRTQGAHRCSRDWWVWWEKLISESPLASTLHDTIWRWATAVPCWILGATETHVEEGSVWYPRYPLPVDRGVHRPRKHLPCSGTEQSRAEWTNPPNLTQ